MSVSFHSVESTVRSIRQEGHSESERQGNRRSSRQILFRKIGLPLSALAKRQWQPRSLDTYTPVAAPRVSEGIEWPAVSPISHLVQFLFSLGSARHPPCETPRLAEFSARDLNSVSSRLSLTPRNGQVASQPSVSAQSNQRHHGERNSILSKVLFVCLLTINTLVTRERSLTL